MQIGLIGLGRIGMLFADMLVREFPEVQITVYSPRVQQRFSGLIHSPRIYFTTDWMEFLTHPDIDGYIIASPSDTHFDYIGQLVIKGKPIFCEKPLDLSLAKIDAIHQMTVKHKIPLTVGFNRRFDPDIIQLKKELDAGAIGIPHIVKITSRDPAPPPLEFMKSSGGLFLDMVIHDFDMSRFLLEDEPLTIYTEADVLVDPKIAELGDVDTAVSTLKFKKGTIVVIDDSRRAVYGYDQRIEVFGSDGMLATKNQREHSVVRFSNTGSQMDPYKDFFMERYRQSYITEIKEFIKICQGKPGQMVSVDDAYQATGIALAAMTSVHTKTKVDIQKVIEERMR